MTKRSRRTLRAHGACAALLFLTVIGLQVAQHAPVQAKEKAAETKLAAVQARAQEALAYAQALDAVTWGSPLVVMYNLRHNDAFGPHPKAAPNSIWRMENISTPKLSEEAGYVTPNVNTLYGFGFLDLGPQPIVLSAPDSQGRYYMVEIVDMWTNSFAYVGGVATGYKGGKFALVGPGWKGQLPAGVGRIDCPTRWVLVQPRVHLREEKDLPAARKVLQDVKVQGLAEFRGRPAPPAPAYRYPAPVVTDPHLPVSALAFKDPLQFWELLGEALRENPPPEDQTRALLPMFGLLGLQSGKRWERSRVIPAVLKGMKRAVEDAPEILGHVPGALLIDGWYSSPPCIGDFKTDYLTRALMAQTSLTGNIPREAVYMQTYADREDFPLTGGRRCTVTFKQLPPVRNPGFWSLTLYDVKNSYTVPNPINRYALGSDNKMKLNPDGSLTIFIQKDSPGAEREANWLPAPPGGYYLALRAYVPGKAMIESLTNPRAYPRPTVVQEK